MIRARSVFVVVGAALVMAGLLAPSGALAQTPPPPTPPDLGLPPATARSPEAGAPATTGGGNGTTVDGSSRDTSGSADESFGAAVVGTFTEPGRLVGALLFALLLALVVGAGLYVLDRRRRQHAPRRRHRNASAHAAAAKPAEADEQRTEPLVREDADQQQSELLALASHEQRKPLTDMKMFVDTVRLHWEQLPEARRRDLLDRASLNADELHRVFDQLLDFSRVDAHLVTMQPQPILVSDAVRRALTEVRPVLADHRVYVGIPDRLAIRADVTAFGDVLTNLLTNAAKFSPAGRRIIVRAKRIDGGVDVSVSDSGSGIPWEEQERIFEPFYQSPYNNESRRGTGIGLTVAKRLAEMQGGRIAVASDPGVGSTFSVTMPPAAAPVNKVGDTHREFAS